MCVCVCVCVCVGGGRGWGWGERGKFFHCLDFVPFSDSGT